jgi:hypothetical protein
MNLIFILNIKNYTIQKNEKIFDLNNFIDKYLFLFFSQQR